MLEAVRVSGGWTQAELSAASGVSQTVISQIESGSREPSAEALARLASPLGVATALLSLPCPAPSIRHALQVSLPARAVRKLEADLALAHARIARIGGVPDTSVPRWAFDSRTHFSSDRAHALRRAWDVPRGPVPDLVEMLEEHGVVCVFRDLAPVRVAALSSTAAGYPTVMFVDPAASATAARWALAHELGHLTLHDESAQAHESSADDFAAELLIPRRQLRGELPGDMASTAASWGVPLSRAIRAAEGAGAISASAARRERSQAVAEESSRLPGPTWIADAVRRRTRAPGEPLAHVAGDAFLSVADLRRDYLAGSRSTAP